MRPEWDEYFKEIVTITSKRSSCARLNVGCLPPVQKLSSVDILH